MQYWLTLNTPSLWALEQMQVLAVHLQPPQHSYMPPPLLPMLASSPALTPAPTRARTSLPPLELELSCPH